MRANASLPLNRSDRLWCKVKEYAVDAGYLVGDALCDLVKHGVGDLLYRCGHSVNGVNGADDSGPSLVSLVILYANALNVGHCDKVLPYFFGKAALVKFLAQNCISLAQCCKAVTRDSTEATNAKAGA